MRVGWRLTTDPAGGNLGGDLASDRGEVVFASGQSQADLVLDVVGDEEPELNEKYIVQLMAPDKVGVELRLEGGGEIGDYIINQDAENP